MSSAIFSSAAEARLGSLGVASFIPVPPLPNIVAEWAAILPLVCHLATQQDDYFTTGDIALRGSMSVEIFPRLGTLSGLSRLLRRKNQYLDYASTRAGSDRTVWDVSWGSVFPCANGAACAAISRCLMSRAGTMSPLRMPERLPSNRPSQLPVHKSDLSGSSCNDSETRPREDDGVRRYQTLHVYKLGYHEQKRSSLRCRLDRLRVSVTGRLVRFSVFMCLSVFFILLGCYGSSALVICISISELVAQSIVIRQPTGYLENNEAHDACMLVASHQNASEWHLFIGDRGIVDRLLNKHMFLLPEGRWARLAAGWFWIANLWQFAAMTFVAAAKGWDGITMVGLLALHWALRLLSGSRSLASEWLDREGVSADVRSFEFGGRTAMLGAIQVFGGNACTRWMDDILVPHPRREAWLKCLRREPVTETLDAHDARWLEFAIEASLASADVLVQTFGVPERAPLRR